MNWKVIMHWVLNQKTREVVNAVTLPVPLSMNIGNGNCVKIS
jgi:hypothetical protein